jgi:hypothetical protein
MPPVLRSTAKKAKNKPNRRRGGSMYLNDEENESLFY